MIRVKKKGAFWVVHNPPANVKYFKTEELALEYKDFLEGKGKEKSEVEPEVPHDWKVGDYLEK